jgi:hypothetical protein
MFNLMEKIKYFSKELRPITDNNIQTKPSYEKRIINLSFIFLN